MPYLVPEIAASLQYVCVVLEFTGILLAFAELRFPHISNGISQHIVKEGRSYFRLPALNLRTILGALIIGTLSNFAAKHLESIGYEYAPDLILYLVVSILISYVIAAYWIPTRAIGVFGLSLALFGLLGEMYQVATTWVEINGT